MKFYTQSLNGAEIPCNPYSTEQERKEVEGFQNVCRQAAYELRKAGHIQPIISRQK